MAENNIIPGSINISLKRKACSMINEEDLLILYQRTQLKYSLRCNIDEVEEFYSNYSLEPRLGIFSRQ